MRHLHIAIHPQASMFRLTYVEEARRHLLSTFLPLWITLPGPDYCKIQILAEVIRVLAFDEAVVPDRSFDSLLLLCGIRTRLCT
jgi:hypothetical protein